MNASLSQTPPFAILNDIISTRHFSASGVATFSEDAKNGAAQRSMDGKNRREKTVDILILGAGLAGTSLAHHLERLGFNGRIALLDCRADFLREQRWCTWSQVPSSMAHLVSHEWKTWKVGGERNGKAHNTVCHSPQHTYREIYAPSFFKFFHAAWQVGERVELHLNQKFGAVKISDAEVQVETTDTLWRAALVFDSRSDSSLESKVSSPPQNAPFLAQTFLGQVIEFDRPVFDAEIATLMDFRVRQPLSEKTFSDANSAQSAGVHFAYVLPYSSRRALVETTAFSPEPTPRATHAALLNDYIAANFGDGARVLSEESGFVPMTAATAHFADKSSTQSSSSCPNSRPSRLHRIGVAGGVARPSSGYAFARIQRHTEAWARQIVSGESANFSAGEVPKLKIPLYAPRVCAAKYNVLDEVFLQALGASSHFAASCFMRLFAQAPPASLVRFLSDESSFFDDARIVIALPKIPFLKAAAQRIQARFRARFMRVTPFATSANEAAPPVFATIR